MSNDMKPADQLTSADIKRQIEEATKAAKGSSVPLTGMIAHEINVNQPIPDDKSKPAESKPDPDQPAAKSVEGAKSASNDVDLKEWAKKRGIDWTTEGSVLSALRKSDQAFHAKRQAEKARENQSPLPAPLPPSYQPPPYSAYTQPVPTYANPVPSRTVVENLARQYNMLPEDFERVMAVQKDFFDMAMRAEREKFNIELGAIKKENEKNSVFRELSSDPVFRRPEVAVEYHNVLDQMQESDPQSFEQNPNAYRIAFDRALQNIARRNLEGRPLQEGVPPNAAGVMTPPNTPPRPLGNGSGGSYNEDENAIDMKKWDQLTTEQQKQWFQDRGLVQSKY